MPGLWVVRADFGTYTKAFVDGGYIAIDYGIGQDLGKVMTREELAQIYRAAHPDEASNLVVGQQAGQLARFLVDIKAGDYVITPAADTELLYYGVVGTDPSYKFVVGDQACPYRHRRSVTWVKTTLARSSFSVPFQNTIRSSLTVFAVSQRDEFLLAIGKKDLVTIPATTKYDPHRVVLEQILSLDAKEFEILVGHLLTALGFEGSKVVGKTGDGGVDATGELNVSNLAKVKVFVQAKRYQLGSKISGNTVRQLRQAIPFGGQGAFITTADYQTEAASVALEAGFPRIGLINGSHLVDLLIENWAAIPTEFQDRLGLKPGLVLQ